MKKLILNPGPLGLLLVGLLCGNSGAHDVLPPCWRGAEGSTSQRWEFNSDANPAAPDVSSNPYGTASASMIVGSPGLGWRTNVLGYGLQTNYWGLGSGSMTLTVPNRSDAPSASWKLVSLQVAQFAEDSIFKDADATLSGATLLDVTNVTIEVAPPAPGRWQVRRFLWRVEPSPTAETITITRGSGLDLFVDEVVVDTLCITNANTYVDAAYSAPDCTLVSWPDGGSPADKPKGILAYADLQTGANRAPAGGIVNVAGGEYEGAVTVNNAVVMSLGPTTAQADVVGGLTLNPGATLAIDINGTSPGTQHDKWSVSGAVNLGSATLAPTCNATLALGDTVMVLEKSGSLGITGTFGNWPAGTTNLIGGQQFKISYTGGSGNDVVLTMVNHAPVAGYKFAATDQDVPGTILVAKIMGVISDPDGDPVSFVAPVANTAEGGTAEAVNLEGLPAVKYTPPVGFAGTDYFYYTVTDGKAVASGTVTVQVRPANTPSFNMLPLVMSNTHPFVRFAGTPGTAYTLQRSVDLSSWSSIASVTTGTNGIGAFWDTGASDTNGFYRTRYP